MKLSTRVLSTTSVLTLAFTVLILVLIFQYSGSVAVATDYAQEIEPAREAIEHLLTTIYADFLLVEEYLLISDVDELSKYEDLLSHSQEQCEVLTEEVDELIEFNEITDQSAITSYKTAVLVFSSWERSRDALLSLHKEATLTGVIPNREIRTERERFVSLMQDATKHFDESLTLLNAQNLEFQKELERKTKAVQLLLSVLLLSFFFVAVVSSLLLVKRITRPLDQMSAASIEFTKGNYKTRVDESSTVAEISSLQKQLNRVYGLVDSTFKSKVDKEKASEKLLPSQYKDILDFIKNSNMQGKMLTIKDIKKEFSLTHPTVISRLRYLEENGYIMMKKQGRNKYLYEA